MSLAGLVAPWKGLRRAWRWRWLVVFFLILPLTDTAFFALAPLDFFYPAHEEAAVWHADAAAVLFHDFADQYKGIDTESKRRVNHAIALYRQGRVGYLIMAGGARPQEHISGSRLMARYASGQGMAADRIVAARDSLDTMGNLASIDRVLKERGWHSVVLVSSPYHLQRLARLSMVDLKARTFLSPYDPTAGSPPLTRYETWRSVHYNLVAYLLRRLLPDPYYGRFVTWVRTHTTF